MTLKKKIVEISNKLRITKEGENPFAKFSYFKPDDILKSINPILEEYNIFMSFNLPYNKEKLMYEGVLYFEDLDDDKQNLTYKFDIPLTKVVGASEAQGAGATLTYAKRYSIMNAFSIADNEDDLDSKPMVKNVNPIKQVVGEDGGECPKCKSPMIIKTGTKKNGRSWRGQQCTNRNCEHYSKFIFLPDQEAIDEANNQDAIDDEAHNIPVINE
jgi:hypothetical protein